MATQRDCRPCAINYDYAQEVVGLLNEVILALIDLPVPVVACVHGPVTGGSLGLVLAADLILVAPEASFTPYYSVIGPSPDGGWTAMLPAVIGEKRAAAVLMLNETISAEQAVAWGMAQRIVPGDVIRDEAQRVAAQTSPGANRARSGTRANCCPRTANGLRRAWRPSENTSWPTSPRRKQSDGFATFVANLRAMKGLHIGQQAGLERVFSTEDVAEYRDLSGDMGLGFGLAAAPDAVPGPLIAGLFSCLLGTSLPGRGTNWLKQTLAFTRTRPCGRAGYGDGRSHPITAGNCLG